MVEGAAVGIGIERGQERLDKRRPHPHCQVCQFDGRKDVGIESVRIGLSAVTGNCGDVNDPLSLG
jgi:hypothetical protein